MNKPSNKTDKVKGELDDALRDLDNMSEESEKDWDNENNSDDDEEGQGEGEEGVPTEKDEKTNLLNAKALERYGAAEDEYAKMQLKDYQQRLFTRTTLLEDMRKAYLRDVVLLKNIMKVRNVLHC